ncbi:hypothetical protein [Cellulomonas sp. C5510]|uniref:hypothetical protein n=1 Tax=Cellulomonas sp. C5510 TaxID=2871170 RepID=UPI001C9402ED|nr:hypothetical protein [Cellulomonas sp. C5510]QZN85516.1 hypothetical protein K5O09_17505 [Cellulomonas sp. C5510]
MPRRAGRADPDGILTVAGTDRAGHRDVRAGGVGGRDQVVHTVLGTGGTCGVALPSQLGDGTTGEPERR